MYTTHCKISFDFVFFSIAPNEFFFFFLIWDQKAQENGVLNSFNHTLFVSFLLFQSFAFHDHYISGLSCVGLKLIYCMCIFFWMLIRRYYSIESIWLVHVHSLYTGLYFSLNYSSNWTLFDYILQRLHLSWVITTFYYSIELFLSIYNYLIYTIISSIVKILYNNILYNNIV